MALPRTEHTADEQSSAVVRLKQTFKQLFPSLWVRWRLWRRPRSAERELSLLDYIVRPDDVTVDVGANLGLYTRRLARLSRKVYAFEPSHAMADVLRRSSADNVVVHEMALSDRDGQAELHIPRAGTQLTHSLASLEPRAVAGRDTAVVNVPRARLDSVVGENVSFVKIDVEGHEFSVLQGALDLIDRCRPVFLVEAEERHHAGATIALFGFFRTLDYEGFFVSGRDVVAVDHFDPNAAQNETSLSNDGGRRGHEHYINNFFFFPSERDGRALLTQAV
jgi:FkbM family methyltransferase